jgi:hypothetical protein
VLQYWGSHAPALAVVCHSWPEGGVVINHTLIICVAVTTACHAVTNHQIIISAPLDLSSLQTH